MLPIGIRNQGQFFFELLQNKVTSFPTKSIMYEFLHLNIKIPVIEALPSDLKQ